LIDSDNGVTVDDCERVSNAVSVTLDAYDPIGMRYQLEVSSPGAERPLISNRDFQRAISHIVKIRYQAGDSEATVQGHLVTASATSLELLVAEKRQQHTLIIERNTIIEAHRVALP
jgi:ribosome maturation factor RimP